MGNPLTPDRIMAERFLNMLDENEEQFTFAIFDDYKTHGKKPRKDRNLTRELHGSLGKCWPEMCDLNQKGAGVFVCVQATNLTGRKKDNITRVRAIFQEADRPGVPQLPIIPHVEVESSPGRFHRYVFVDGCPLDGFGPLQERLVQDYGSDPNAKDLARVLRLPGTYHMKDPDHPYLVRILSESGELPLSYDEAKRIFPAVARKLKSTLADTGTPAALAEVQSALAALNPDMDYHLWLSVGMALHGWSRGCAVGLEVWDTWSSNGTLYRPDECVYKWNTFEASGGVTIRTIFGLARDAGWKWDSARETAHSADTEHDDEDLLPGLLERVGSDCGVVHLPEVVATLARLKERNKARFVRLRDDLKKAHNGVLLTELDKDILHFLKTTSKKESSSSSPSTFSGSYTSPSLSSDEENPHHQVCFIRWSASGRGALCQQSEAALVLAEHLRGHFAFDSDASTWLHFVGTHWEAANQTLVERKVQALLYAGTSGHGFTHNYQRGVMAILQRMSELALGLRPSGLIPFANGLLDMKTNALLPTTPEIALTWCLPFEHDQSALCQKFQKWLANAVDGDKGTVRLIRAFINAVLVGRPDLQRFLHLCGPGGTGKSTLERLVLAMVGPNNATTSTLRLLEENRFETAGLYEKRLVCIDEADKYGGSVSVFKKMTGQDPLRMERKNQQQGGSFIFKGQVLITSNERFSTKDLTSGIERRRVTVEFTRRITEQERAEWELRGGEESVLHAEIPGIINWALELSRNEVTEAFKVLPERVRMANIDAAMFNNPVLEWMLEDCVPDCSAKGKVGDKRQISDGNGGKTYAHAGEWLYPTYVLWCQQSERKNVSLQKFSQTLVEAAAQFGVKAVRKTSSAGAHIEGLRLRREDERMWRESVTNDHCNQMRDGEGNGDGCDELSTIRYYKGNEGGEAGEALFDIGQYTERNEGAASLSTDDEIVEEEI